jgi:hypothetical protein
MRRLRVITLAVLVVVAAAGWAGGLALLTDRSGGRLGLSVDVLPSWPLLDDYTLPGIVLTVLFGVLPVVAVVLLRRHSAGGWSATTAVGLLLVVWSVGQIVVIGLAFPAVQTGAFMAGIVLTGLGIDGAASVGTSDESGSAVESYEHADDES